MKNGIVIPCYNEETRLRFSEYLSFIEKNPKFTLCFVNNGSKDETLQVLKDFQKEIMSLQRGMETQVMIYDMPKNSKKEEAVKAGMNFLNENTNAHYVGFVDAGLTAGLEQFRYNAKYTLN